MIFFSFHLLYLFNLTFLTLNIYSLTHFIHIFYFFIYFSRSFKKFQTYLGWPVNTIYLNNACHKQSIYCWLLYTSFIRTIHQNISYMRKISEIASCVLCALWSHNNNIMHRGIHAKEHTDNIKIFFIL